MRSISRFLARNFQSGLTVALVIASNATPVMGIVTAVWEGLMGAVFGGSRFKILGPAAVLSSPPRTPSRTTSSRCRGSRSARA